MEINLNYYTNFNFSHFNARDLPYFIIKINVQMLINGNLLVYITIKMIKIIFIKIIIKNKCKNFYKKKL